MTMFVPKLFTENFLDDWMDDFSWPKGFDQVDHKLYGKHANRVMLTDIREHDDHYEVEIDLPGFKKEDIKIELNGGYLNVSVSKGLDESQKNNEGHIVRQERYQGTMSRSFFVGNEITNEDIKAKFENGVLSLNILKKDKKEIINNSQIMID